MGSNIENGISTKYMAFLYIISGFGGNLLSSVLNPTTYGVGASTAVFGLVGFYFQYIFTHWDFMGYDEVPSYIKWTKLPWCQRVWLASFVLIFIAVSLAGAIGYDRVDQYAHAGGLVTGFLAGIAICEWLDQEAKNAGRAPSRFRNMGAYESRVGCDNWFCHWCGTLFLVAWIVTLISVFYLFTVVDDTEYYDNIEVNYQPPETPKNEAE